MLLSLKFFRSLISCSSYRERHVRNRSAFTRDRKLNFKSLIHFLLCKSVKSLQLRLNEFAELLGDSVTASALSQARGKLGHTAFIELLEQCVVQVMYGDGDYEKFKGYRLLAIDGSTLHLPRSKELLKRFGQSMKGNEKLVESKLSVLHDVLNSIPLSAKLFPGRTNDIVAAQEQLLLLGSQDIVVCDRGYDSYEFFSQILKQKANFLIRCRDNRLACKELLASNENSDVTLVINAPKNKVRAGNKLPQSLKVRFVRIVLESGEVEVLATSLLDKKTFPHRVFKKLYAKRWKVETFFQTLKSRLAVDNFTGRTEEAILQDLHSTIFISGLATILTEDADDELGAKNTLYPQQVNKAVAFHAIKNTIVNLMFENPPDLEAQVKALFMSSPTLVRPRRKKKRIYSIHQASGIKRSLFFQKHQRKHVF